MMPELPVIPDQRPFLSPRLRKFLTIGLLLYGVQVWLVVGRGFWGLNIQVQIVAACLVLSLIPVTSRWLRAIVERLSSGVGHRPGLSTACIFVLAAAYLFYTIHAQRFYLPPTWHDEFSYALQANMLAHGRLWMPALDPAIADFFDSFYILTQPAYASIYFPGAAFIWAPTVWLGVPMWWSSVLCAAGVVALAFRIALYLSGDAASALLAPLLLISLSELRLESANLFSHIPVAFAVLLAVWAWLHWRASAYRYRCTAICGAAAGWALITRPPDAVAMLLPLLVAIVADLRKLAAEPTSRRAAATNVALGIAAMTPFLAIQIAMNLALTGGAFHFAHDAYSERDWPMTSIGFHEFDASRRPKSVIAQKQMFYDEWAVAEIKKHTLAGLPARVSSELLPKWLDTIVAHRLLYVLLPVALVAGVFGRHRVLAIGIVLAFSIYAFYAFYAPRYALSSAPAMAILLACSTRWIAGAFPSAEGRIHAGLATAIGALCITCLPELNRFEADQRFLDTQMRTVEQKLNALERRPAVVLFRFQPGRCDIHQEPVFNATTLLPDQAEVIRAHDLGSRNVELYRYFAQRQPGRAFYLYDRADDSVTFLGDARDLANQ